MLNSKPRFWIGLVLSPALVLVVLALLVCVWENVVEVPRIACVQGVLSFVIVGLPFAVVGITMALPFIWFCINHKFVELRYFLVVGVVVSLFVAGLMIFFGEGADELFLSVFMVAVGANSSVLFWVISIKGNVEV